MHYLQELTELDPALEYYHWYARTLIKLNKIDEALPIFRSLVNMRGDSGDFHWYGKTLLQNDQKTEALTYLRKALETRGNATDYLWYGICLYQSGMYAESVKYLTSSQKMGAGDVCSQWLNLAMEKIIKSI